MELKKNNLPIWIAMTGSITVPYELLLTIEWLSEKISLGIVDGIVLSTWKGQFDKYHGLKKSLECVGINIIELDYPKYSNEYIGFNSREIQDYQLLACLNCIPNESLILKCRTDLTLKWLINNEEIIFSSEYLHSNVNDPDIRHRIICDAQQPVFPPFRLFDKVFMGHKSDLQKIIQLTNTELTHFNYSPDERLFAIHSNYPIIKDFMMRVNRDRLFKLNNYDNSEPLPGILRKAYALYFVILYKYYYPRVDKPTADNIEDILFGCLKNSFVQKYISWSDIRNIVEGKLKQTPIYTSIYSDIICFLNVDVAKRSFYSDDDWYETEVWGLRYLKLESKDWLKIPITAKKNQNMICHKLTYYSDIDIKNELDNYKKSIRDLSIKTIMDADRVQMLVRYNDREALFALSSYIIRNPSQHHFYISSILRSFHFMPDISPLIQLHSIINNPSFEIICQYYRIPLVKTIDDLFEKILLRIKSDPVVDFGSNRTFCQRCSLLLLNKLFIVSDNIRASIDKLIYELLSQKEGSSMSEITYSAADSLSFQMEYGIVKTNDEFVLLFNNLLCLTIELNPVYGLKVYNKITISGYNIFFNTLSNLLKMNYYEIIVCYARCYRDGKGVEIDLIKAADWMRKAHEKKRGCATKELFDILWKINTLESDKEAFHIADEYYNMDSEMQGRLGRAYREGRGVDKDLHKAADWMRKAHEGGVKWADWELFDILWRINTPESMTEALGFGMPLAESGVKELQGWIARCYREGRGVEKDLDKATEWMRKAYDQKLGYASWELFDILWRIDTPESLKEAVAIAEPLAQSGNRELQGRMGRAYRDGKGVEKSLDLAREWFKKAADQDLAWAKIELFKLDDALL